MNLAKVLPSVEYLRECFLYDEATGELRWKDRPPNHFDTKNRFAIWRNRCAGQIAGTTAGNCYREVGLDGEVYRVHRIVWKLTTGGEPPETIDHIDGDRSNNSWINLRAATSSQQQWNKRLYRNNTSGKSGVILHQGKWMAQINHNRVHQYLGMFDTIEQASQAYNAAARSRGGEFYRGDRK